MIGGDKQLRADRLKDPAMAPWADTDDMFAAGVSLVLCFLSIGAVCAIMWLGT